MNKYIFLVVLKLALIVDIFGDVYEDIRNDLLIQAHHTTIVEVAKQLNVNARTLGSFLNKKTATSPTVKKAYESWKLKAIPLNLEKREDLEALATPADKVIERKVEVLTATTDRAPAVARKLSFSFESLEKAPVHIPIRGTLDDKDAKGVYFDHFVVQRATGHLSKAVVSTGVTYPFPALDTYIKQNPYALPYGLEYSSRKLPLPVTSDDAGLLIIPGRMRDREYDAIRSREELALLRKAFLRGQPVLGICAGSWRIWDMLRQIEHDATFKETVGEGLVEVSDHSAARMMSFSESTGRVVYNIELHGVKIEHDSLLHGVMGKEAPIKLNVNSVHWKSPSKDKKAKNVRVVAVATEGDVPETHNRHGKIIKSETDVVEAFETLCGAPILGVQWHPEAYNPHDSGSEWHLNILRWMAKAGDAYAHKRKVLKELVEKISGRKA